MKTKLFKVTLILLPLLWGGLGWGLFAQEVDDPFIPYGEYQYPAEPEVLANLREWQDLKFGLFIHWGTYSQWGIVESWTLCPEDNGWNSRPEGSSYFEYVKEYEKLATTFNPVKFAPEKWAAAARDAGMRYVTFTTKHHDGFNMFDTKHSDYKITAPGCPFASNPRANIAKEVFQAFRNENFKIGAYFSIADWNHNDYWWKYFPPKDRNINYSIEKYPEKWKNLNNFIYNQLEELVSGGYGKIDMLWFDLAHPAPEPKTRMLGWNRLTAMVHSHQPQTMMVARWTGTIYENYKTPEQEVPEETLPYPWETCMTMAGQWSYNANDTYKPARQLVQTLAQVVSRGGNYLLNVGPGPDGELHPTAYQRLKEIGAWMKVNSDAIYGTQPIAPYKETKKAFTKKGDSIYAIYLADENETKLPAEIRVESFQPAKGSRVYLLGYDKPLAWEKSGAGFMVKIPQALRQHPPCEHAWVIRFQQ
jgi:alpha-L-fucosidase